LGIEVDEGALILAAVADFVAIEEFEGAGVVGEIGKGEGSVHGRDLVVLLIGVRVAGALLYVDGVDVVGHLDAPEAAATPVGDRHDFDETALDGVFRLEEFVEFGKKFGEAWSRLAGENDGGGEQAVTGGILGGAGAALRCDRPVGVDGVGGGDGFTDGRDRSAGFFPVSTGGFDTQK
jgi:hypothetical protein